MSVLSRLTFIALISLADDEGRGRGDPRYMMGSMHGYAKDVNEPGFQTTLKDLQEKKLVAFYVVDDAHYYALPGWKEHQYIEKPKPSKIPPVPSSHPMRKLFDGDGEGKGRGKVGDDEGTNPPRNGREGKGLEGITTAGKAPAAVNFGDVRIPAGWAKGAYVKNLSAEDAAGILREMPRLGSKIVAALKWRVALKTEAMTPEQRKTPALPVALR